MLLSFIPEDEGKKTLKPKTPLSLPLNCSFHSYMDVRNDYDDKYEVRKGV